MKVSRILFFSVVLAVLFSGCSSSKDMEPVSSDVYSAEDGNGGAEESGDGKTAKKSGKKQGNSIGDSISRGISNFFASKFVEYDQSTLFAAGTFGGIKQQNAIIVIYPKTGDAGFGSPIMAAYYYVLLNAENRKKLDKAVSQYLSDFENKKLDRKSKKSFKKYGTIDATIYWGTVKNSSPNYATSKIYMGYSFEKNSPYFSLFMYPATNQIYTGPDGSSATEKSITLKYCFTKSQAKSLVARLSDENVSEALHNYEIERYGILEESDEYDDYDEISDDGEGDSISGVEIDEDGKAESDGIGDNATVIDGDEVEESLSDS